MNEATPPDLINTRTAANLAQLHITGIVRWTYEGRLRGWRRGGRIFVSRAEVLALFQPVISRIEQMDENPNGLGQGRPHPIEAHGSARREI